MPKLDLNAIVESNRTGYPAPYDGKVSGRFYRRLAPAAGLADFGVSHVRLEPGAQSSERHWHEKVDEFLVMLSGEAVLVEDGARTSIRPGDCAAWAKGVANGHMLVNESDAPCTFVVVGRNEGAVHYPDADMLLDGEGTMRHADGQPY